MVKQQWKCDYPQFPSDGYGENHAGNRAVELTYKELYENVENIWSVMFTTGYLTQRGNAPGGYYQLTIPNQEIRQIFVDQIQVWFEQKSRKDAPTL